MSPNSKICLLLINHGAANKLNLIESITDDLQSISMCTTQLKFTQIHLTTQCMQLQR
jgi:hypothetical protein